MTTGVQVVLLGCLYLWTQGLTMTTAVQVVLLSCLSLWTHGLKMTPALQAVLLSWLLLEIQCTDHCYSHSFNKLADVMNTIQGATMITAIMTV